MRPAGTPLGLTLFLLLGTGSLVWGQGTRLRSKSQLEAGSQAADKPATEIQQAPESEPLDALQNLRNELKETKDRLHAFEAENEVLRRHNELSKQSLRTLNESLAVANAESELFRRRYGDLRLQMEALGLASVGDNKEALEQRLLKAVRDLGLVREDKDKLSEQLVALTEAVLLYIKTAPVSDPRVRMDVETQIRAANQLLDDSAKTAATSSAPTLELNSGSVVSVKEDLSLLVANIGARNGVKVGMPFRVTRGSQMVAKARVIDVRDRISGAIIEDLASTDAAVKIGDRLQVDAQQ